MKKHKYKFIIFICIIMLILVLFFVYYENKNLNIPITDANPIHKTLGYSKEAKLEKVYYYFSDEENENKKLIFKIDDILKKSEEKFNINLNKPMKIYFNSKSNNSEKTDLSNLFLNQNDMYSTGAILSFINDFKLPAWLSAGIELHLGNNNKTKIKELSNKEILIWIEEVKNKNFPSFGDVWFIPDLIDNPLKEEIWNIAYSFVNHLEKVQVLDKLVSLYIKDNRDQAEAIINKEWSNFISIDYEKINFSYKFLYFYDDMKFEAYTNKKVIYQFYENKLNYINLFSYINKLNQSIEYVEKWFNYKLKETITCKILYTNGQSFYKNNIINLYDHDTSAMVHETVHAISDQFEADLNYIPFSEGLACVIQYNFDEVNESFFLYNMMKKSILKAYEDLNESKKFNMIKSDFNMYKYAMSLAFHAFQFSNDYKFYDSFNTSIPDLNCYNKSNSFVYYLIEEYGKDKFLKVYFGTHTFEVVYNMDILKMIEQWKTYLSV